MKLVAFVLLSVLLAPSLCVSQSPKNAPASRDNSVVSVQELAMSRKAVRAFEKGTALLLKGDSQGSIAYFRTVIDEAPTSFRAYHNLGLAFFRLGQIDAAADAFQKAVDLSNGYSPSSLLGLSMIFYRRADFLGAEALIRRALFVEPASSVGKYCLGLVQFSLGHIADAQKSASEAIALNPLQSDAYVLLARIHERLHDPSAVLTDIQNYLRLDPHGTLQPDALVLLQRAQQELHPLITSLH